MKVLYAVYNISGYLLAELKALAEYADITVIETPCNINKGEMLQKIRWIDRRTLDDSSCEKFIDSGFNVFICPGWADKLMLRLAKVLKMTGAKTVLSLDTPWRGGIKQWVNCLISRIYLVPKFDYAWGAGVPQKCYSRRLGFSKEQIYCGTYCADTEKFSRIGESRLRMQTTSKKRGTRTFLYIGRYVSVKNMRRMEHAFIKALEKVERCGEEECGRLSFKLRCVGGGDLWKERTIHPAIEHLGYKQPAEIQEYVKDADCFVLPSLYEPWGVVVHEAALMALPMICSSKIQAATKFLTTNGYTFDPLDEDDIEEAFIKIMSASDEELCAMRRESYRLGMSYTTKDWANRLLEMGR